MLKKTAIQSLAAVGKALIDFHKCHRYWQATDYIVDEDQVMRVENVIRDHLPTINKARAECPEMEEG